MIGNLALSLAALTLSCPAAEMPEAVDVLVIGGTTRGIEAAKAAKAAGKSVYLTTFHSYLGEDLAGTLELGDLRWPSTGGFAAYDYFPDRPTDGIRWIYKNDEWFRLAEPNAPATMADGVLYLGDVTFGCVLRQSAKIAAAEVTVLEADTYLIDDVVSKADQRRLAAEKPGNRRVATGGVELKIKSGPRRGETVALRRREETRAIAGCFAYPPGRAVVYEAELGTEFSDAEVTLRQDPSVHHQLVSRIRFRLADEAAALAPPSPLKVKRAYDRELIDRGIGFMTMCPVRKLRRDSSGKLAAVEFATRSGRRTVRAGEVVDATLYGTLGILPAVAEKENFSRIVISDRGAPSAPGMKVERLAGDFRDRHSSFDAGMYRCSFTLPMKDGSFPSFAAAEWEARELTKTVRPADEADVLVWHPSPAALAAAKPAPDELPDWGEYDVVVVGGGTSGAAAGIAAARNGAKTLIVEYLDVLGGTGTDGMVNGWFDGNLVGFTAEFLERWEKAHGHGPYRRAEVWRALCREAGATVWLGALGLSASAADGVVEVSTALGTGRVRAKCIIDATGNSDVAAAAGAETDFYADREIAVQSAGCSPHRLGVSTINSDFGYLDDADAAELRLFGIRARAGAPDAWDIAKLPGSRERRRIVPDYRLRGEDVVARRRYPDTVAQARSRQDPHGILSDDFGYLAEESTELVDAGKENRAMFNVNLPLRSLLPKGLPRIAVVGLGAGIERDVVAITRMQADLMNMGYGVGVAAALAAAKDGDFRKIDLRELRRRLTAKGVLEKAALDWDAEDDIGSDALLAAAVKSLPDGYRGGHVLHRPENRARALPLLREAYAAAENPAARQTYALALGLLGDAAGVETLLAVLDGRETSVDVRGGKSGKFSSAYSSGDLRGGMLRALGRTRDPRAVPTLKRFLAALDAKTPYGEVRTALLAAADSAQSGLAPSLAAFLALPGVGGHAVKDASALAPLGGYGVGPEYEIAFRELLAAKALLACGDPDGLARGVFTAYASDPRRILSTYAKKIIKP